MNETCRPDRLVRCAVWCRRGLIIFALLGSAWTVAADKVGFWLAPQSNVLVDGRVADEVGSRAGMVVLRAARETTEGDYSFPAIVGRIKDKAPDVPVLSYAWITRYKEHGRIESYLLRGLNLGRPLAVARQEENASVTYLDITDPNLRRNVVERLVEERGRLGVDGFAVDLAVRKPFARPKPLANICGRQPVFCEAYARGMDEVMQTLNQALGGKGVLLYNGLWNFAPGVLDDQAKLLPHADAVAVEYFGMNPQERTQGFSKDVLPYLEAFARLPKNKPVLVFGRGSWGYVDYASDFRWQRYLYASFLLGRRAGDLFKYHSSFQVPAHAGRAGGLDVYSDWNIDLGYDKGPYRIQEGLYLREFNNGIVVVAPDDAKGGRIRLTETYYQPDGSPISGNVDVKSGEALILLNAVGKVVKHPLSLQFTPREFASWNWRNSRLVRTHEGERIRLETLRPSLLGEHDLLLDFERSLVPYERLEINASFVSPGASVLAVAEIDDPQKRQKWAIVAVESPNTQPKSSPYHEAVYFRAAPRVSEDWPLVSIRFPMDGRQPLVLDGPQIFAANGYLFRRWSHARLIGPIEIASIKLTQRSKWTH